MEYILIPIVLYVVLHTHPSTFFGRIHGAIDWEHEGERVVPLMVLQNGGLPYRDAYIQHGLIQNALLPWLGTQLFGDSLASVRRIERDVEPFAYIVLYLLGLQLYRGRMLTALLLIGLMSGSDNFVSPRVTFGILSVLLAAVWLKKGFHDLNQQVLWKDWRLPGSCFLAGIAFWYSAEVGIYTAAALCVFLFVFSAFRLPQDGIGVIANGLKRAVLGGAAGFAIFSVPVFLMGAGPSFIDNTMSSIRLQGRLFGMPFPGLKELSLQFISLDGHLMWSGFCSLPARVWMFIAAATATSLFLFYRGWTKRLVNSEGTVLMLLLLISGIMYFRTTLGRSLGWQIKFGSLFFWPIVLMVADRCAATLITKFRAYGPRIKIIMQNWNRAITLVSCAFIVGIGLVCQQVVPSVWAKLYLLKQHQLGVPSAPVQWPQVGAVNVSNDDLEYLHDVSASIDLFINKNDSIYVFSNKAAHYYLLDRLPVTRFFFVAYAATSEYQQEVIDHLEECAVPLILDEVYGSYDGILNSVRHPILYAYIQNKYREVQVLKSSIMGPVRIMLRIES